MAPDGEADGTQRVGRNLVLVVMVCLGVGLGLVGLGVSGCGTNQGETKPAGTGTETDSDAPKTRMPALAAATAPASTPVPQINPNRPPGPAPEGMVWVPGGTFWMGGNDASTEDAAPAHLVTVDGFWMDRTEVTNRQFAEFVKATGYVTVAENNHGFTS